MDSHIYSFTLHLSRLTPDTMRCLFIILSIAYIAGIFLLANSSVVSDLSTFNPYSILHIPLYGILTVLLILSIAPMKLRVNRNDDSRNPLNSNNPSNSTNLKTHFLLPGGIALIIAIADEIHQAYVPGRDASVTDVLLDLVGIALVLFLTFRLLKTRTSLIR
jgi:hypothetical protein